MKACDEIEIEYEIQESDLAKALSLSEDDDFPSVFATSRMIALMELAAARLMKPLLTETQLSVGVGVNVTHVAATPKGEIVKAKAMFISLDDKLYRFVVEVYDKAGLVGTGQHTRAIIEADSLLTSAEQRILGALK